MTKRLLALVLVCVLAIPILAVPVSATTTEFTEYESSVVGYLFDIYDRIKNGVEAAITSVNGNVLQVIRDMKNYYNGIKGKLETLDTNISGYFDSFYDKLYVHFVDRDRLLIQIRENTYDLLTSIDNTVGHIYESIVNSVLTVLQDIEWKMDSLISGGDQKADSDDFKSDVDDAKTELDEAGDVIDSATLPTIEDNFDASINITISNGSNYFSLLKHLFRGDFYVGQILLMSFTLSTVAYVFFGKRG